MARLHSRLPLMMLKPGGPPKFGRQEARASKGVADVNAKKDITRLIMVEAIVSK